METDYCILEELILLLPYKKIRNSFTVSFSPVLCEYLTLQSGDHTVKSNSAAEDINLLFSPLNVELSASQLQSQSRFSQIIESTVYRCLCKLQRMESDRKKPNCQLSVLCQMTLYVQRVICKYI